MKKIIHEIKFTLAMAGVTGDEILTTIGVLVPGVTMVWAIIYLNN